MTMFHLLKIRTSIDIFKNEKCKVTFGLEYIYCGSSRAHKVHSTCTLGGLEDGRKDGMPKTMSLCFSLQRRWTKKYGVRDSCSIAFH